MGNLLVRSRAKNGTRRKFSPKTVYAVVLSASAFLALATPHIFDGHLLSLSTAATQTVVLALNLSAALLFLQLHRRAVAREQAEKNTLESRLDSSFRYIGRANVSLRLEKEFSAALAGVENLKEAHGILSYLHTSIAVGVARATSSRLRIVSIPDRRTVTEFEWTASSQVPLPKISNNKVVDGDRYRKYEQEIVSITSDYRRPGMTCIMRARIEGIDGIDYELLRALVNQFFLLYVFAIRLFRDETEA